MILCNRGCKKTALFYIAHVAMIICKAGQEFATLTSLQKNSDGCSGGDRSVAAFAPPFFCEDRSLTTVLLYKSIIAPLPISLNRAVFSPCLNAVASLFPHPKYKQTALSRYFSTKKRGALKHRYKECSTWNIFGQYELLL